LKKGKAMTNTAYAIHLDEILGSFHDASFLGNHLGLRMSRTHLLARGLHIDLSTLAEQAGFQIHVFFRREAFVRLTENQSQFHDGNGDLYDAMLALRQAMIKAPLRDCPVLFQSGNVTLVAHLNRVDHDDPRPAVTVVLAPDNED
jgi:hypothetical protein